MRRGSDEDVVERRRQAVDVRAHVDLRSVAVDLLRAHVSRCAEDLTCQRSQRATVVGHVRRAPDLPRCDEPVDLEHSQAEVDVDARIRMVAIQTPDGLDVAALVASLECRART